MKARTNVGRLIGILLLLQFVGQFVAFYTLMSAVGTDYLNVAVGMESTMRTAVFLLFVNAAITLVIAIAAFPVFREYSVRMAAALLVFSGVWIVMQSVDNAHILAMLSLSKEHSQAAGAHADIYELLATQARSTRVWLHYTELLVIDVWFALFFGALFAFRLVPRLLPGLGLLAVALHLIGIPLAMFIGYPTILPLAYGIAVSYLLIGGWLAVRGFSPRQPRLCDLTSPERDRRPRRLDGDVPVLSVDDAGHPADMPLAGGGSPHGDIGSALAVVVARDRLVGGLSPADRAHPPDPPLSGGGPPDRQIALAVAGVVSLDRLVIRHAVDGRADPADPPLSG